MTIDPTREKYWQQRWHDAACFTARDDDARPRRAIITMFPYPSGDLHMGHAEVFAITDVLARYARARGYDVLCPFGWDSFGLPAENAAIRSGESPVVYTEANIATQKASIDRYAVSVDWTRRLHTHDPAYYRWTQWLFTELLRRDLAYQAEAPVNWCPRDHTVLANEQVIDGACERCGSVVETKVLTQWFIRSTAYAEQLLAGLDELPGWPTSVKAMQRHWIGRRVSDDGEVTYRLHDWLVSRQRFWGAPVPVIHCRTCGPVPVPASDLPVRLPDLRGEDLLPGATSSMSGATPQDYTAPPAGAAPQTRTAPQDGAAPQADVVSPLARATDWVQTSCPECGAAARRDTDTLDTFVDSSWYFLRYCSPGRDDVAWDPADVARWLPAHTYTGGVEHATGHLLYARIIGHMLHDAGLVPHAEPFQHVINQGQVINQGKAMSKSLGNGVSLAAELDEHGVDVIRTAIIAAGPPEDDLDWADVNPPAVAGFLRRCQALAEAVASARETGGTSRGTAHHSGSARSDTPQGTEEPSTDAATPPANHAELRRRTHRTVHAVGQLIEAGRLNVAVSRLMELVSAALKADPSVAREAAEAVAVMLSLVAPYTGEEMWATLGHTDVAAAQPWPEVDPAELIDDVVTCVVQVDGKPRARLEVHPGIGEDDVVAQVLAHPDVRRWLAGHPPRRVIARPPRLVSVVTR